MLASEKTCPISWIDRKTGVFKSTIIVIPAKNEESSVAGVIELALHLTGSTVLLVDDASTDNTAREARKAGAKVLSLATGLGAWGALQTGIRYAVKHGYQFVITMDADGQHDARELRTLIAPVFAGDADVAIGGCTDRASGLRKFAWAYLRKLSGLTLEDITSGFRAYDRKAMELLASREATLLEYQDIGVLAMLLEHAMRIREVPVSMELRTAGHSRVFSSWFMVAYYMLQASILGISKRKVREAMVR